MKKLFLHMGLHKTATTSFQATCSKNAEELSKQNYLYPVFINKENRKEIYNHSIPIFSVVLPPSL